MQVHHVLSNVIAGFGYEAGTLRVVFKGPDPLKAYDYLNVSEEDFALFTQDLGKALKHIKSKYKCVPVTDWVYFNPSDE